MSAPDDDPRYRFFEHARNLPPQERAAYLDKVCAHAPDVRSEVESLLRYATDEEDFLRPDAEESSFPGPILERLGPYRILREIGAGGMGVVYLAEQQSPQRRVALKVMACYPHSRAASRRFELEGELLGRLQHPGIAQIFESGTDVSGSTARAYLAMEYIDGLALTRFCDEQSLDRTARIRLLIQVARAIQHAHLKGVVHRDLKPSNILVTGSGEVKVIDFGVAHVMDADGDGSLRTRTGEIVGTLNYMSPEQVRGEVGAIDSRTDVYALGVLCFELLAGHLPYDLRNTSITRAAEVVCTQEPQRLGRIAANCRGDLEWIVARALEKEPSRRYRSAESLASDLERYLRGEPITARPASAIYQLSKIARRHRVLVLATASVLIAIVLGAGLALHYALKNSELAHAESRARSQAERNATEAKRLQVEAEEQARELRRISEYQHWVLARVDAPSMGKGITQDILSGHGRALAERGFGEARIEEERAALVAGLGMVNSTEIAVRTIEKVIFDRALNALSRRFPENSKTSRSLRLNLAMSMVSFGLHGRSEQTLRAVIQDADRADDVPIAQQARFVLARVYQVMQKFAEARELIESMLATHGAHEATSLPEQQLLLRVRLGTICLAHQDLERAEGLFREVLDHPASISTRNEALAGLGSLYALRGQFDQAEDIHRAIHDTRRKELGERDPETLDVLRVLGYDVYRQGRFEEARQLLEAALQGFQEVLGEDHDRTLMTLCILGNNCVEGGHGDEGLRYLELAVKGMRRKHGAAHPGLFSPLLNLTRQWLLRGRADNALDFAEQVVDVVVRTPPEQAEVEQMVPTVSELLRILKADAQDDRSQQRIRALARRLAGLG